MAITGEDLERAITGNGFLPVRIEGEADITKFKGDVIKGSMDDFFKAAKALGAKCVFILSTRLMREYFIYEEYDEEDRERGERLDIDLTLALPALAEFRKDIGREGEFILTAKGGAAPISFHHCEDWWDAFLEQRELAMAKVEKDFDAYAEKMRERREAMDEEGLRLIKDLINDSEFVHIPTQRGMKSYALGKHPELDEMDPELLATQIQILSDRIKAKGLDTKR